MAKVIIGIHGLCNKVEKNKLEEWWKKSIEEGLNINLDNNHSKFKFKMVYWADLLYDKPLEESIKDKKHKLYLNEPYIPQEHDFIPEQSPVRKKVLDYLQLKLDKILLNDDLSTNYSLLTNKIVEKKFGDLATYYSNEEKRNAVRERLASELRKHKKDNILLLTHSMGTIISYEVLSFLCPDIKIDTLITIGSPLGFPLIKARIATEMNIKNKVDMNLKTPENINKDWFNLADINDNVAMGYKLSNDYLANSNNVSVIDYQVHNDYIFNGERNYHKSFGYLRTPELTNIVYKFIKTKRHPLVEKIIKLVKKSMSILKNKINR
ncbi:MAG: hypothetical protein WBG43_03120 [Marinifilaceae bacterium]